MMKVPVELLEYLQDMLQELKHQRLTYESGKSCKNQVSLDPSHPQSAGRSANGCRMIVVKTKNPKWYRDICSLYLRGKDKHNPKGILKKKPRTIIKRRNILKILQIMIKKEQSNSKYAEDLIEIAQKRKDFMEMEITDNQVAEIWAEIII